MKIEPIFFAIFVVFCSVSSEAFGSSKSSEVEALRGKRSAENEHYPASDSSDNESLNSDSDDEGASLKPVDCSDVTSAWGRALVWAFAAASKHKNSTQVRFLLSSRIQRQRVEIFPEDDQPTLRLDAANFIPERRTVLIVHGFKSSGMKSWVKRIENALLAWDDVNVIVVDWSEGRKSFNYYDAAKNTKIVGSKIARFLHKLLNSMSSSNRGPLHFVGHSLGAHISGIAARDFKTLQDSWPVNRITGLDPAHMCFKNVSDEFRLDSMDANFVDVIHTSASQGSSMGFGEPQPLGSVDFYVNGGRRQPGCGRREGSVLKYLKVPKTSIEKGQCSHRRSYMYFAESLESTVAGNCTFWAYPWNPQNAGNPIVTSEDCNKDKCTEMGINSEFHPQRGTFFVETEKSPPYCIVRQK